MAGLESLLKGRELAGRYRIEEVIGRGGMGAVYRGTDLRLGRPIAVKVITASSGNDAELRDRIRARFRHEASAAAKLPHHPNVVPVYDYGTDEDLGLDYIVMELLRGHDLASRFQRGGPPPMAEALRILQHAARGVAVGHRSGLIHRDVKPGNIFLVDGEHAGEEMQVRVLDFGIAKAMAEEDNTSGLTQDGRAPLSPAFASPEQIRNEPRLTPASDVFSLGAVGFQLLSGDRPFTEIDRNRMGAGMDVPTPSLRARNPGVPEEVEAIIRRALASNPVDRFPHAGAMADALEGPLRRLGETPAAALLPGAGALAADDDRTMVAGVGGAMVDDDHTMMSPPRHGAVPRPVPTPEPGYAQPVINRPRGRPAAEPVRRGVHPMVWVLLVLVLGAAAFFALSQGGGGGDRPLAADSIQGDTVRPDSVDPTDPLAMSLEAQRHYGMGQFDSALVYAQRAVELAPSGQQGAQYRDQAAAALIRLGRYADAVPLLESAIRMDRRFDLAYSHLAEARLAMADTLNAIKALEGFVEVTQAGGERDQASALLKQLRDATTAQLQPVPGPLDTTPSIPFPEPLQPQPQPDTPRTRPAPRDTIVIRDPG
jgi:tetratricopeptide (TPR) repeat protein/tRNA A-37 threonylcarbamoyl transferase component Bud32